MRRHARSTLIHYLQGLLMGGADVIPGVSGGTVALIVGIYERLITSVRAAAAAAVAPLSGDLERMRARLREVHWSLVVPLGIGIVSALLVGARVIPGLLEAYPVQMRAIFFGLIAGSLAIPWRRIAAPRPVHYGLAVAAAVLAFVLVGLPPRAVADPPLPAVFAAASVAICAMILPGVSGSFLLLVMGIYEATLIALRGWNLPYIAVFVLGAAVGLGLFSKLLDYLLRRHHDVTMAALVGLMAGSLRALWPYLDENRRLLAPPADASFLVPLALAVVGFVFVTALARMGASAQRRVEAEG